MLTRASFEMELVRFPVAVVVCRRCLSAIRSHSYDEIKGEQSFRVKITTTLRDALPDATVTYRTGENSALDDRERYAEVIRSRDASGFI